jgi:hypothetical protein
MNAYLRQYYRQQDWLKYFAPITLGKWARVAIFSALFCAWLMLELKLLDAGALVVVMPE